MFIDRPVGIDLGTTNSEIAILDPSERDLHLYEDRFGRKTVPSAVAWDAKKERFLVGRPARNRRGSANPPVESIKRRMGRSAQVKLGPHSLTPEEVSGKILGELRSKMQEHLQAGAPEGSEVRVDRAVITVPAYFDAPQMEATHRAGALAGLEVLAVLQEPTAAAIYHAWQNELTDGNYLIYDLGGGTFDVSILRCLAGEYQVLAIDGDNFLGGDDFDRRYAEHLRKYLVEQGYRLDLDVAGDEDDAQRFQRLVHVAQEIKEMLSTKEVVSISKSDFASDQDDEAISLELEVGRDEYSAIVSDLVATTIACCTRALEESQRTASVGVADLDHVILVGGSTRVPSVIEAVRAAICADSRSAEPLQDEVDTCVALGAAIHAAQLGGLRLGPLAEGPSVLLPAPLVSKKEELNLDVVVEPAGATLRLRVGEDQWLEPSEGGPARFVVPMPTEGEHPVVLEVTNQGAAATYPFVVYRGDVRQRASNLSQPSVVAKDIGVDVVRSGQRTQRTLVARGQGLPAEATHTFYTSDQSGAVVLRILQDRLPIKTLVVEVPDGLEVGTPVNLSLSIDDAMRIEAKAEVGGQELWARIESSELDTPRSAAEVEALLAEGEAVAATLWGHEAESFRYHFDSLKAGLRETLGTDPDKAAHLAGRLRRLLDNFRTEGQGALQPPMFRFEHTLNSLRRDVFASGGKMLGLSVDEWEVRIGDLTARGESAWNDGDARAWRRVYNEAQALAETANEKQWAERSATMDTDWGARLADRRRRSERLRQGLIEVVLSSSPEVRALQEAERLRLMEALDAVDATLAVADDATVADVRRVAERSEGEIARIRAALDRIPELGIVADRG